MPLPGWPQPKGGGIGDFRQAPERHLGRSPAPSTRDKGSLSGPRGFLTKAVDFYSGGWLRGSCTQHTSFVSDHAAPPASRPSGVSAPTSSAARMPPGTSSAASCSYIRAAL
eukprot:scaffold42718_cov66-Phaeocystis_antarctica.AAC.4